MKNESLGLTLNIKTIFYTCNHHAIRFKSNKIVLPQQK